MPYRFFQPKLTCRPSRNSIQTAEAINGRLVSPAQHQRFRWRLIFHFLVSLCLTFALSVSSLPLVAQPAISQGRISEILDGSEVYIQNTLARVNDVANRGQQVRTGVARTQVNFNTGAVARLSRHSVLTIGQCAQLQRGVLLVNGAVNGCTSSVTAGVRGTTYILEVDETGQEQIKVLEGEVIVTKQPEAEQLGDSPQATPAIPATPTTAEAETVTLSAGQKIATRKGQRLGEPVNLTVEEFLAILNGDLFRSYVEQLPGLANIRSVFQRLYPGVPFPLSVPSLPIPRIPRPRLPFF